MTITRQSKISRITYVVETGHIEVQHSIWFEDDANGEKSPVNYHRHVVAAGDDVSNEDAKVQEIANRLWTPEIIAAEASRKAAREAKLNVPNYDH